MNDEQLKVIYDLQDLLGISYQEAYKIVDEYIYYGDVDLSDFEDDTTINTLTPIHKNIILNIMNNVQTVPLSHTNDKEVSLNIKDNQENISYLKPRDKEVLLNIMNNVQTVPLLHTYDKEVLLHLMNNQEHISKLTTKDKEVVLSLLNNTKIELLTTKPQPIDLGISNSNDSIQFLNTLDKEVSYDVKFGNINTPNEIMLDTIIPLSISSISSIYQNDINVNTLDKLSISDIPTINDVEQEELKPLSIRKLPNIHDFNVKRIDKLSLGKLPNIHELNVNEIDSLSINKLSNISNINVSTINELNINNLPNVSMKHKLLKYIPYLTLNQLPSITPFDIQSIDTLQLSKLDDFKWGRINARVNKNDLPLLSLNPISNVNNNELSELDELVLYDIPQLPNFDIEEIKSIEYQPLHLDDSLDVLNEITKREVLPPVTKQDFINAGADPDTVDMYFNDYLSTSESYNLETMRLFFKHALTEKDRAIEAGGNYKGLYKIVTEERGTFLSFITEFYMTNLCQYDEDVGTVIIRYHSMLEGFLINEANYYNSLI